jgi:EpsI family protein
MDGSLFQGYRKADARVAIYLAVYRRQSQGAELINDRNFLVVQKDPVWDNVGQSRRLEPIGNGEVTVRETRVRSRNQRLLIWDWYLVGGRHLSNPYHIKLLEGWSKLRGDPDHGVAVMLVTPTEERTEQAEKTLRAFAVDMIPSIEQALRAIIEADQGIRP